MKPGSSDAPAGLLAPFRRPRFRVLWVSSAMSLTAFWMTEVACAWQMRLMTDADPLMVAAVLSFLQFPIFILVIPAGVIADLADRRRIMSYAHVWMSIIMLALLFLMSSGDITPVLLLACMPLVAIGQALRMPTIGTLIPDLVPRAEIPSAISLNGMAQNGSRVLGPAIAGTLVGLWGPSSVFGINAISAAIVALLFARLTYESSAPEEGISAARFLKAITDGLRFAASTRWQRNILTRFGLFFLCVASVPALMAVRFDSSVIYGIMYGCFGAGAMLGLVLLSKLHGTANMEQRIAVGKVIGAISLVSLGTTTHWAVAGPLLFVSGASWIFCSNSYMVSAQLQLPNAVRGRGLSFVYAVGMACLALGAATWGYVAKHADPETALMLAGLCLFGGFVATRHLKISDTAAQPPTKTVDGTS